MNFKTCLFALLLLSGCSSKFEVFYISSSYKISPVLKTLKPKSRKSTINYYKEHVAPFYESGFIRFQSTYMLPYKSCDTVTFKTIVSYVDTIYIRNHPNNYKYLSGIKYTSKGDSLITFHFPNPVLRDVREDYIYNKNCCFISYIRGGF